MQTRIRLFVTVAALLVSLRVSAQPPRWNWKTLTSIPKGNRYNDLFFVSPQVGWTIHPYQKFSDTNIYLGRIYKTTDGGSSWTIQVDSSRNHFRCMGFADSLHGWVFSLGGFEKAAEYGYDTTLFFETTDGGATWFTPENNIEGPRPRGLCGLSVVNADVIYACGRVGGPAYLLKTTNNGKTWRSIDMKAYAPELIDCHFWSEDSGIVVGGTHNVDSLNTGLVLFTSDGGDTWVEQYRGDSLGERCWKISFPSRTTGYVTLENPHTTRNSLLKTIDGGKTWERKLLPYVSTYLQGVGFINDTVGWTGGWYYPGWQTTTGTKNWTQPFGIGMNINRFRFFGDSLGYCAGQRIYRITLIRQSEVEEFSPFNVGNYPNPFEHSTDIRFTLDQPEHVLLKVYSMLGVETAILVNHQLNAGPHVYTFTPNHTQSSAAYLYMLHAGTRRRHGQMLQLR